MHLISNILMGFLHSPNKLKLWFQMPLRKFITQAKKVSVNFGLFYSFLEILFGFHNKVLVRCPIKLFLCGLFMFFSLRGYWIQISGKMWNISESLKCHGLHPPRDSNTVGLHKKPGQVWICYISATSEYLEKWEFLRMQPGKFPDTWVYK